MPFVHSFHVVRMSVVAERLHVACAQLTGKHCDTVVCVSGLVHGDLRSHVILSPPCIVAGSNHVCESIAIAVNTAYEDHGDLPRAASVQLDNASPNHSMLVFGFASQYVLFGIFDRFRVRFELAPRPTIVAQATVVKVHSSAWCFRCSMHVSSITVRCSFVSRLRCRKTTRTTSTTCTTAFTEQPCARRRSTAWRR